MFIHSFIHSERRHKTTGDDESVDVCADDNVRDDDDGGERDDADDIVGITHRTTTNGNGNGNGKWRFG